LKKQEFSAKLAGEEEGFLIIINLKGVSFVYWYLVSGVHMCVYVFYPTHSKGWEPTISRYK